MKKNVIFLFILLLYSCEKEGQNNKEEITLDIVDSEWFTKQSNNLDCISTSINLSISGSTNAEKVTVDTYGDGNYADISLLLDSNGIFKDTVIIEFSMCVSEIPTDEFNCNTNIKAYRGLDTLTLNLKSGKLQY